MVWYTVEVAYETHNKKGSIPDRGPPRPLSYQEKNIREWPLKGRTDIRVQEVASCERGRTVISLGHRRESCRKGRKRQN